MMKKHMLVAIVFLLTGCPGPGDRMVSRESATAIIKDNHVCVVSPLQPQEYVTAIQINSWRGNGLHKIFDDSPISVEKGNCLPLFGYAFIPNERYSIAYDIKSSKRESHLVVAEFSTAQGAGGVIKIL